jgi:hypothetical protein
MLAMESKDDKQIVRTIKDVIKTCTEGQVDVNKMTMFDMEYIFIKLRTKSVGELTNVGLKCEHCEAKNTVPINLDSIYVSNNESNKFIELTPTIGIEMRYPSMNDATSIQTNDKLSDTEKLFELIGSCIAAIHSGDEIFDTATHSKTEIKEFIESFNSEQFSKVRDFIEAMPAASIDVKFTCVSCKEANALTVRGMSNFFS